jgi:polysaccharide biosynthesis protein PslH
MRILIITVSLPYPPTSGGEIRVNGIIDGLLQANHDVTLLTFHSDDPDSTTPTNMSTPRVITVPPPTRQVRDRLRELLFSRRPDIAGRFFSEEFARRLRALLATETFDVIQFEGIESVDYLPTAGDAQPAARLVFDTFNAEYALQRGIFTIDRRSLQRWPAALYSYLQAGRIARYESEMCHRAHAVIAVSPEDAALLQPLCPPGRLHIVPSGIQVDRYKGHQSALNLGPQALVFTGTMDYRPNIDAVLWFTTEIFPRIRAEIADAQLYIVGQRPHPRLEPLRVIDGVTITGRVESVPPYLHGATVYIAPLRMGSGTRLKLLEAMACGCAIVATSTAAAGLTDKAKSAMVIVDQSTDLAAAVVALLKDPEHRRQLGQQARIQVKAEYDWPVLMPRLLQVYRQLGITGAGVE